MSKSTSVFDVDGKPSIGTALPLALQHLLAMIIGNITPCIVLANLNLAGTGPLSQADTTLLIQSGMFIAAIATLIQLYPVWKFGARLPMIMGISFAYIPTLISIGLEYGIAAVFGAQLVGGITAILVGIFIKPLRKYFPPVVAGTVVLTIGLSLYTVAMGYIGGGNDAKGNLGLVEQIEATIAGTEEAVEFEELKGAVSSHKYVPVQVKESIASATSIDEVKDDLQNVAIPQLKKTSFGSIQNWILAIVTLVVTVGCAQFGKGYFKLASILIGIIAGYVVALAMGMVNFAPVQEAGIVMVPKLLPFGMEFPPAALASMIIIYIVNSIQAVGDFTATTMGGMGRQVTDEELSGGIMGSGISSAISSFFGGLPIATYSQNVGIVATTKVVSRFVFAITAIFILIAGFIPKFGGLMSTIPQAVLGGATLTVFGSITMSGIRVIVEEELTVRNVTIVGLSVAFGMGVSLVPEVLDQFPKWVSIVFGGATIIATILSFTLNLIIPNKSLAEEQAERDALEKAKSEA